MTDKTKWRLFLDGVEIPEFTLLESDDQFNSGVGNIFMSDEWVENNMWVSKPTSSITVVNVELPDYRRIHRIYRHGKWTGTEGNICFEATEQIA